ncbi:hypothetical protein HDU93_007829 [Gonapodya sp. JEL0774]|nr:hypothetical protein HDU93_007829 [Gonapodya sp. JEL0774]
MFNPGANDDSTMNLDKTPASHQEIRSVAFPAPATGNTTPSERQLPPHYPLHIAAALLNSPTETKPPQPDKIDSIRMDSVLASMPLIAQPRPETVKRERALVDEDLEDAAEPSAKRQSQRVEALPDKSERLAESSVTATGVETQKASNAGTVETSMDAFARDVDHGGSTGTQSVHAQLVNSSPPGLASGASMIATSGARRARVQADKDMASRLEKLEAARFSEASLAARLEEIEAARMSEDGESVLAELAQLGTTWQERLAVAKQRYKLAKRERDIIGDELEYMRRKLMRLRTEREVLVDNIILLEDADQDVDDSS